jgi:hypothetical protein
VILAHAAAGGHIVQSRCGGAPDELWLLEGAASGYVLQNAANRHCLHVPSWVCNGGINQTWRYMSRSEP